MEMLKLLLCCVLLVNFSSGCKYAGHEYDEGDPVPTEEPCLNCACTRGSLVCHLRICPTLPDPPPRGCLIVHKAQKCCPQLVCEHGSYEDLNNSIEARSGIVSLPELDESSKGCVINGTVYAEGSATDTSSLCQYCYCIRGVQHCVKPKCLLNSPGCSPVYNKLTCCPTKYNCTTRVAPPVKETEGMKEVILLEANKGCSLDGNHYLEGDKVEGVTNSSCVNCYCIAGKITCEQIICTPPVKHSCRPVYHVDHCCPISYDCNQSALRLNTSTSLASTTTEAAHKIDESSLEYYANISSVNINKNTLDGESESGVENRIITNDEPELNKSNLKAPTESTKPPNSRIENNTRNPSQKLHKNELNSMPSIKKPIEKPKNESNHVLLSTSSTTKTNANLLTKVGTHSKPSVNNTKTYVNNNKTMNKTSTVNNKNKTQNNSTKNALVTNKVVNKIISQSLISSSNKTASTAHVQTSKIKTNNTINTSNKLSDKNTISLRLNQSNIIKPNVEQLVKNQPNRLQGNIIKHNSTSGTATKEYVKLPIKTAISNKNSTQSASLTKYEKISSSNDLSKTANGTTKADLPASNNLKQSVTNTGNDSLKDINQVNPSTESVLKIEDTKTKSPELNSIKINESNATKTDNDSNSTFATSDESVDSSTEVQNEALNTNLTSTEHPSLDNNTSSDSLTNEIKTANETLTTNNEEMKSENETIVERTKAGSIDSLESNVTASNVTAGSAVRATMSNKSIDLDYDYDSLPPSLPNLKIIPFVAADAVVDETNSFKREDTESIIPITENPSYLDPFSNFFSPPVRTEGGFVPKEPILDGPYFESKIETASTSVGPVMRPSPSEDLLVAGLDVSSSSTADPDFSAPLITFTEFSPEKLIEADYHCLFSSKVFKHGELVSHIDDCKVCVCFYGDIACQEPKCPEVSAGCRRVDSHGGCCGKIECDSNDIISTQIKDRFDEDAHINASSTSGQHRIEYIHLSEHQFSPTGEESNAYDTLANSNADTADGKLTYITTTEEPSIEYISNNKYVIVKPAQNKQTYQTTTYKSILDDILPFFWQSEVETGVKGKNETEKISEVMSSSTTTKLNINENIESSHLQGSNFTDHGTEKINAIDNKHSLTTGDVQTGENDFHLDHDKENTSEKNGSGEDLFSSLLHSFSSMYSSMDSQKQKLKPGNKNNVRIKPIVSHKPSVKTTNNDVSNQHPVHLNLGSFSSSTVKTTTLFIPILRYNSTATKYYSVLETTPELTNKNVLNHVQEDTSGEIPGITRTELYNRVTQAPQINHIIENNRHRVKLQSTTETFLVTSKPDISETTYSYFKPSDIVTNRVAPNLLSSSTETIGDTKPHKNQYNYYEPETLEIFKSNIKSDEENESNLHQTVSSDHLLTTTNTLELLDSMQTSTKTYDSSIHRNKTTPPLNKVISTTEKEPDLFSEILGNFFATIDKEAVASNNTKQTTKAPVKSNVLKTTDKPVKDDYEDNFSFDTFLSSWFNDDTPSSTKQPPKKEIESRIDTDIDDPDNEEYDEDYNGEIEDSKPLLNTTTKQEHQEKHANKEELNRPFKSKEKVVNGSENLATTAELTSTAKSTSIKLDNAPDQFDIPSLKDDTYVLVNIRRPPVNETFYGESITNKGNLAEQEVVNNSVVKIDKLRNNSSNERTDENKADKMENNSKTPNAIKNSETTELNKELHLKANENSNGTNHAKSNDTQTQTEEHKQQSQTDNSEINVEHLASKRDEVSKSTTTVPITAMSDSTTKGIVQTTPHYEHHELKLNNYSVVQSTKDSLTSTESLSTPTSTASEVPPEATVPIPTTFKPQYKPHPPTTYRFTSTTPRAAEESYRPTAKPFPSSLESISTTRRYFPPKRPTHTYRPSTYRPKVKFSLPPRSSMRPPPTTAAPAFNPLKIDECNIYGSIYKVGTSIAELSTECLTCLCTSMGVQCSGHCGHP